LKGPVEADRARLKSAFQKVLEARDVRDTGRLPVDSEAAVTSNVRRPRLVELAGTKIPGNF